MQDELTDLSSVLIGSVISCLAIAASAPVFTAMFGFKTTLWGVAIFFIVCALGVLAMWCQEKRRWSRAAGSSYPGSIIEVPSIGA